MIKTPLLKIITIVCLLTGAIMGVLALIPFLSFGVLTLLMFIIAPFVIIYFKNLNLIKDIEIDQGIFYGGISGFIAFIGFSITFFPLAFIIDIIFKTQTFLWVSIVSKSFLFLSGIIIFTAMLSALLNMFTGFLTAYVYQYFKK
ncbi:MAG: hypothetical protein ACI37R_03045 [Candidatus Avigastranaerophilus sp.]